MWGARRVGGGKLGGAGEVGVGVGVEGVIEKGYKYISGFPWMREREIVRGGFFVKG